MHPQMMVRPDGQMILLVHFVSASPDGHVVACVPNLEYLSALENRSQPWQRSDDPRAVTCPLCQNTDSFQEAVGQPVEQRAVLAPAVHLLLGKSTTAPIIACAPKRQQFDRTDNQSWQCSDDVRAVTCLLCQVTPEFAALDDMADRPPAPNAIHFAHLYSADGVTESLVLACQVVADRIPLGFGTMPRTDDPRAVTCGRCQKTPAYLSRRDALASAITSGRIRL